MGESKRLTFGDLKDQRRIIQRYPDDLSLVCRINNTVTETNVPTIRMSNVVRHNKEVATPEGSDSCCYLASIESEPSSINSPIPSRPATYLPSPEGHEHIARESSGLFSR